ncbi:golgin subfamily A member 6-like protein 25 [Macrobrachium nipponense]|uniref:golgin subfamily A member 6-like protein 25 n=1 Tax=Macrobrachium nipponense TaxID=159736 RepID=UPI0030C8829D
MTGTRTPDDRRGAIKMKVVEVSPPAVGIVEEGREEVADEALNQLKNDLDETSERNQELLKENIKLLEKEGALRQRIDELQKVLIRQEVDHRHQLAVVREEADASARAAEDQAAKMKDLQEKYDNVNDALGWRVIEIDLLKADIARKAVKLATDEMELLTLQERANGAEAENSRLRKIIADDERRLQVPQEEDIAALKFDVALKEREIAEVRRALDEESRRNKILQSEIETLKSRVSKQEENGDENAETKQETKEGLKTREERTEDDDVRKAIGVLKEGQAALQRRMNEELEKREKMEQLLESLLNKVEEKPGRTTEAKRQECSEEEEDEGREEVVSESLYAYYSDSAYCLLATEEFARLEEGRTEEEAEDEASMSGRRRKGKKRKRPLAWRFRAKRWKQKERSSVLEFIAQIREGKKVQNKKNRTTTTKRHLNYYDDMPETQALRQELARQDKEHLYLKDQLSNRKVRYQRLRDELGAKKLENMVLQDEVAEMKENVRIVNAAAEDLEKQLNRANCIVTQQDEEIDVLKRKLQEMNLINKKKSKICDEKGDEFFQCARQKAKLEEQVEELQRENEKMRREGDSRMCELEQKNRQLHLLEEELKAKNEELKREIEKNPENLGLVDALEGRLQRIIRQKDELAHQEEKLILMCRHQKMLIERYKHVIDLLLAWREKVRKNLEEGDFNLVLANLH